jgi:hypothetical protein
VGRGRPGGVGEVHGGVVVVAFEPEPGAAGELEELGAGRAGRGRSEGEEKGGARWRAREQGRGRLTGWGRRERAGGARGVMGDV